MPGELVTNFRIQSEPVVYSGWQHNQVALDNLDSDPPVPAIANIKIATALQNVTDLLIRMKVLLKEHFELRERDVCGVNLEGQPYC